MEIHPDADFRRFLQEGCFMLQRSASSGRYVFYPRVAEPGTGATDLEWVPASGEGTVYSSTTVRKREPGESYNVSIIELSEGPRMMSRVIGIAPENVEIGMAVRAKVVVEDDVPLVIFEPATAGQ